MSSTYSPNLALELIGAGEQAGNWGSTTNTNLGTLLEQAISGYTTYSCTGGTDTLTMTNGASATARNMFLQLNGTGGGSVVVPATSKLYFIFNNTASAITVKVTTGISVPAAAKMVLVCNGTDVAQAVDTIASIKLTGTPVAPTAAPGTNTTQVATTAFVAGAATALSTIYPIGSIYISTVSTTPATLFGFGTWVTFGTGRVLLSQDGSTYTAGATGGSATTTLSTANLPSHTHTATSTVTDPSHIHTFALYGNNGGGGTGGGDLNTTAPRNYDTNAAATGITVATSVAATGSGTAATTISPYIAVYMWNRTA